MSRIFNFSAGPAVLPESVLKQAQAEMLDFKGAGSSIMEMSHRSKEFVTVAAEAEADLRELMAIPDNYKVLFMQGGATGQFGFIPMNLLRGKSKIDYVHTGAWAKKAIAEAKKYSDVNIAASSEDKNFSYIPEFSDWNLSDDAAYVHITQNETIGGLEFHDLPETNGVPIVSDFSSTLLSRPIDVTKYGLIYAGAQKNVGPAGLTIVIVRDDLIGEVLPITPSVFDYAKQAGSDSMLNTPPAYSIYIAGLVFKWLKDLGGLKAIAEINERKAKKLYAAIDDSSFYSNPVAVKDRSWMNVPFVLANSDLDKTFLEESTAAGLHTLKGHRSVGGMRASIYNAMPEEGVDKLIAFMQDFAQRNS